MYAYKSKVKGSNNWNIGIHAEAHLSGDCVYVGDLDPHIDFVEVVRRVTPLEAS